MARFPIQGPAQAGPVSQGWGGYQATPQRQPLSYGGMGDFSDIDPAILEVIGDLILRQSRGEDMGSMFRPPPPQASQQDARARRGAQQQYPGATMSRDRLRGGAAVNEQGPGFAMRQPPQQMPFRQQYQPPRVAGAPQLPAPSMPQPQQQRQPFRPLTATTGPYQAMNLAQANPYNPGYGGGWRG